MKYTDEQIKKALECCSGSACRNDCPLSISEIPCDSILSTHALDLINRQEAEKAELQHKIANCNSEIERLQRILDSYALQYGTAVDKNVLLKQAKSETIKEFA